MADKKSNHGGAGGSFSDAAPLKVFNKQDQNGTAGSGEAIKGIVQRGKTKVGRSKKKKG